MGVRVWGRAFVRETTPFVNRCTPTQFGVAQPIIALPVATESRRRRWVDTTSSREVVQRFDGSVYDRNVMPVLHPDKPPQHERRCPSR